MTSDISESAKSIEREDISACIFPENDVLLDEESIKKRARKIHRATSLGNLEQQKVSIFFQDSEELKCLHTTIWAQTGAKIILKENVQLPVHRILEIKI
jgi:uncharacterized protein (UPF0248 family)